MSRWRLLFLTCILLGAAHAYVDFQTILPAFDAGFTALHWPRGLDMTQDGTMMLTSGTVDDVDNPFFAVHTFEMALLEIGRSHLTRT